MPNEIPNTGLVRVRVLQVNTLSKGEVMHDLKVRVLPRDPDAKPTLLSIRDEICPRAPVSGDRLKLTMQAGAVAGVEVMASHQRANRGHTHEEDQTE